MFRGKIKQTILIPTSKKLVHLQLKKQQILITWNVTKKHLYLNETSEKCIEVQTLSVSTLNLSHWHLIFASCVSEHSQLKSLTSDFCFMFAAGVPLSNGNGNGAMWPICAGISEHTASDFKLRTSCGWGVNIALTFQCWGWSWGWGWTHFNVTFLQRSHQVHPSRALWLWPICAGISEHTTSHFKVPASWGWGIDIAPLTSFNVAFLQHSVRKFISEISREHAVPSSAALCSNVSFNQKLPHEKQTSGFAEHAWKTNFEKILEGGGARTNTPIRN